MGSPAPNPYLQAIYGQDQDQQDALYRALSEGKRRQEELDAALYRVLEDSGLSIDIRLKYGEMLLQHGASPNVFTQRPGGCPDKGSLLILLCNYGMSRSTIDHRGRTYLHLLAQLPLPLEAVARSLISIGIVDPNAQDNRGWTAFALALSEGNWEMVEELLPFTDLSLKTNKQETPLHILATYPGEPRDEYTKSTFITLIEAGVDLEAHTSENDTVLGLMTYSAYVGLVEVLINAGCNVNSKNREGLTALHFAAGFGDESCAEEMSEICKLLIQAGADANMLCSLGTTPLNNCLFSHNFSVMRQLLQVNAHCPLVPGIKAKQYVDFMQAAIKNNAKDCALFVFQDSMFSPKDQQHILDTMRSPEATVATEGVHIENSATLGLPPLPISLYRMCRIAIRAMLPSGPTFNVALDQLSLAPHVKDFVAFRQ